MKTNRPLLILACTFAMLTSSITLYADEETQPTAPAKPTFEPNAQSLKQYTVPQWYNDAKLGIYFHWAPFSVPAYQTEWYPKWMYNSKPNKKWGDLKRHHETTWGPLNTFGYKDFIPMFKAEKWDPEQWVKLFEEAGAKYLVSAAVHHDGFALWDSEVLPFNAADMGPRRDIVGEFCAAARKAGLKTGVSTHFGRHWCFYEFAPEYDNWDPKYSGLYGRRRAANDPPTPEDEQEWQDVLLEVINNYHPDYIFVDGGIGDGERIFGKPYFRQQFYNILSHYYNQSQQTNPDGVVLTYKREFLEPDEAVEDFERKGIAEIRTSSKWQTDEKIAVQGWCCVEGTAFWPAEYLVAVLADTVSKNGNLLLNVGPLPDGTIRQKEVDILHELGGWLKINGEAIYGTRPWIMFGEGDIAKPAADNKPVEGGQVAFSTDAVRLTQKNGSLYAICFGQTGSDITKIKCLKKGTTIGASSIENVEMLGHNGPIDWKQTDESLSVVLPEKLPCDYAIVLKIN